MRHVLFVVCYDFRAVIVNDPGSFFQMLVMHFGKSTPVLIGMWASPIWPSEALLGQPTLVLLCLGQFRIGIGRFVFWRKFGREFRKKYVVEKTKNLLTISSRIWNTTRSISLTLTNSSKGTRFAFWPYNIQAVWITTAWDAASFLRACMSLISNLSKKIWPSAVVAGT